MAVTSTHPSSNFQLKFPKFKERTKCTSTIFTQFLTIPSLTNKYRKIIDLTYRPTTTTDRSQYFLRSHKIVKNKIIKSKQKLAFFKYSKVSTLESVFLTDSVFYFNYETQELYINFVDEHLKLNKNISVM